MLSAKTVIRPNAPPANISNIPKIPPTLALKTFSNATGSIPGKGMYEPILYTIRPRRVNIILFFRSSALPIEPRFILDAICSETEAII